MTAAEGASIIVPTSSFRLKSMPCSSKSSLTSAKLILHWRSSSNVLIMGSINILEKRDLNAVSRLGGKVAELAHRAFETRETAAAPLAAHQGLLIGVQDANAPIAVHNDQIAPGYIGDKLAQADNRRNFQ